MLRERAPSAQAGERSALPRSTCRAALAPQTWATSKGCRGGCGPGPLPATPSSTFARHALSA
eukprot:14399758-Alexandrium_andersonii.AAC.1